MKDLSVTYKELDCLRRLQKHMITIKITTTLKIRTTAATIIPTIAAVDSDEISPGAVGRESSECK